MSKHNHSFQEFIRKGYGLSVILPYFVVKHEHRVQDNAFSQRTKLPCPLTNESFEKGHTHTGYYIIAISGPVVAYYVV